jgi:hypothetical protein
MINNTKTTSFDHEFENGKSAKSLKEQILSNEYGESFI